jgi:hypothetical protein
MQRAVVINPPLPDRRIYHMHLHTPAAPQVSGESKCEKQDSVVQDRTGIQV